MEKKPSNQQPEKDELSEEQLEKVAGGLRQVNAEACP